MSNRSVDFTGRPDDHPVCDVAGLGIMCFGVFYIYSRIYFALIFTVALKPFAINQLIKNARIL